MFSSFTTEVGTLLIPTQRIVSIIDTAEGCIVQWEVGDDVARRLVIGTAAENFERLKADEIELMEAAAERQRRYDTGLPLLPVPRGRMR